jgi:hypothetical protein
MITINLNKQERTMLHLFIRNNYRDIGAIRFANLRPVIQSYLSDRNTGLCYCNLKDNAFNVLYWDKELEFLKLLEHGQ